MTFPHYFHIFSLTLHPHPVMEVIAYSGGFQLYLLSKRRWPRGIVPFEQNLWILVGAVFGALIGSKMLAWAESWPNYWGAWMSSGSNMALLGGKTIVGGLLGGWAGVEAAKKILGIRYSTGDAYIFPLIFGMSVGRVGCFLTGLSDHTYGNRSSLPWAVDFGDGPRHPTQLYDICFLAVLAIVLWFLMCRPRANGWGFRIFVLSYCAYRFCVEFIKPTYRPYLGTSAIQLACLGGCMVCLISLRRLRVSDQNRECSVALDIGTI